MTRWLPVPTGPGCPTCGRELTRVAHTQEPPLRGAGYGAATRTVLDVCDRCWTARLVASETLRPARNPRPELEDVVV